MVGIVEFLEARISEDEDAAMRARGPKWIAGYTRDGEPGRWRGIKNHLVALPPEQTMNANDWDVGATVAELPEQFDASHVARWSPARVLAECKAKRSVIEQHNAHEERVRMALDLDLSPAHANERRQATHAVLCALTQVYADHSDFDSAWG